MNNCSLSLAGAKLVALGSGALWWPAERLLCVSDLHLGKSERIARRGGTFLPPYETRDTLLRLADDLDRMNPATVICLGDSFDDLDAARALAAEDQAALTRMQAGRRWIWIAGNHDSGPVDLGGTHLAELALEPLIFRHIAQTGASGEISGHYHPKASLTTRARRITRAAFLSDRDRIIMPAYGTYTGGLRRHDATLTALMRPDALAILTGPRPYAVPMPR